MTLTINSILGGACAVACYEKFIRKDYFLPYLYFGNTACKGLFLLLCNVSNIIFIILVLYAVSHMFLVIFVVEERDTYNVEDESQIDFSHNYGLYAGLIISAFGSYFINLASFRLLENWVRSGQNKDTYLSKYSITILCIIFSFIPVIFSVAGDIILTAEANRDVSRVSEVEKALALKLLGATCNVILSVVFISLFAICSWSAYINNTIEKAIQKEKSRSQSSLLKSEDDIKDCDKEYIEKTFKKVVIMLLSIGILTLIRFTYDLYIIIAVTIHGPVWDAGTYLVLVVAVGNLLLITVLLFDLTAVKQLVVVNRYVIASMIYLHIN